MRKYIFFGIFIFLIGCEEKDTGAVSFGSNDDLLNCIHDAIVFLDGDKIGVIPGYCNTIVDCTSDYTLNHIIEVGSHNYKIVLENELGGTCYMEKTGSFTIEEGECLGIFFDVTLDEE